MELKRSGRSLGHLGYCTNIHPGESWVEVERNLREHVPGIRDALCPDGEFGIGLRLSAVATRELADPATLAALRAFLDEQRCYVFTINGFPYGPFHGTRVKEEVYLPDWQDPERLRYTNQLADVFASLLHTGRSGSISTVPGAFKTRVKDGQGIEVMARHMVEHAAHLARLERDTGVRIALALEPEPCCFLETVDESIAFFSEYLHGSRAARQFGSALGIDENAAVRLLRRHLTLCLDLCHAAIEFENPDDCFDSLEAADISIGKLQISSGLRLESVTAESAETLLRPFVDDVYLHQVVERHDGELRRFPDLPAAFASLPPTTADVQYGVGRREWRVHFHVPVFLDDLGDFSSTQFFIRDALDRHRRAPVSDHLEVETYTWDVLPERFRKEGIEAGIIRELRWVRETLLAPRDSLLDDEEGTGPRPG